MTDTTGADAQPRPTPAQLWERELTREPDVIERKPDDVASPDEAEHAPELDDEPDYGQDVEEFAQEAGSELEAEPEGQPQPAIQAPPGMTADQVAAFSQASPELQMFLVSQEANRTADYNAKTSTLAADRKAAEAAKLEAQQQLNQAAQVLQQFAAAAPKPPDASLRETDPDLYTQQAMDFMLAQQQQQAAQAQLQAVQAQQAAAFEAERTQAQAAERVKLAALLPGGSDPVKLSTAEAEITAYALTQGYSQQQLDNATAADKHVLFKAMQYDRGKSRVGRPAGSGKPRGKAPGGSRRSPKDARGGQDFSEVASKAVKDGGRQAGASLWQNLLENQGK